MNKSCILKNAGWKEERKYSYPWDLYLQSDEDGVNAVPPTSRGTSYIVSSKQNAVRRRVQSLCNSSWIKITIRCWMTVHHSTWPGVYLFTRKWYSPRVCQILEESPCHQLSQKWHFYQFLCHCLLEKSETFCLFFHYLKILSCGNKICNFSVSFFT